METLEVGCFVVRDPVVSTHEYDTLPFEGQSADRGGMRFATPDLVLNEELGPRAMQGRLAGILEEALVSKTRPGKPAMGITSIIYLRWPWA